MSTKASDSDLLEHVTESIEKIRRYSRLKGTHHNQIPDVRDAIDDAIHWRLQTLGQSTKDLSSALKASEPKIPWRRIAGLRDRLAHDYLHVDPQIIQDVIDQHLTPLEEATKRMTEHTSTAEQVTGFGPPVPESPTAQAAHESQKNDPPQKPATPGKPTPRTPGD